MEILSIPHPQALPKHVAIIMDGNGRWAAARGMRRTAGHKRGAEAVKTAVEAAVHIGVRFLTLFSFSSENWKRPLAEVSDLMGLLRFYLRNEVEFLHENGVRFRAIGDRSGLSADIVQELGRVERDTADNRRLTLLIALNYGARAEIVEASRRLAALAVSGAIDPASIDETTFASQLYTDGIPDPDLLIRTSGEKRISNFLLWQLAYAEFIFLDTLWPDFGRQDFEYAIREYQRRERRYGAVGA